MQTSGLVPTRFMLIIAHLVITILLFWASGENIKSCLPEVYSDAEFNSKTTALTVGLALTIVLLVVELIGFMSGITMFMSGQGIISIFAHASASITLAFFIFESWPCDWFWYVFGFCSVLPGLTEIFSLFGFLLGWNV